MQAGLFAGILTAFLIESSKDLKEDPQQNLLKEILNTLRNSSESSTFEPEPSSLHVNGLWFTSLTLTLMSALGGVLAKGWLAKYNPASYRVQASDACARHLRASRARDWKLESLITAIPLLIQVSLFLFFAGLIIQVRDDDVRIWTTITILVGSTAVLYIFGTFLPFFSPACPFQTPISNLIPGGTGTDQYRDGPTTSNGPEEVYRSWMEYLYGHAKIFYQFLEELHQKPEQLVVQLQILSSVITSSTKQATVEDGIRVVAGSKPTKELQDIMVQGGVRESLYKKLQDCVKVTPGLPKTIINPPLLEALLHALLRIEQPLYIDAEVTGTLTVASQLPEGHALHRWDDFEPYLQPLAFSLRVHILLNYGQDDHEENWTQTIQSLERLASMGCSPHIRGVLFFAALRGFLRGQTLLRRACEQILSKQILIGE